MTYESLSGASPQLINLPQASARSLVVISRQEETRSIPMEIPASLSSSRSNQPTAVSLGRAK